MILFIDNYDSFTYNLVQYFGILGVEVLVRRNDALPVSDIDALAPAAIVISPGPCSPAEAGVSVPVIQRFSGVVPILGVCLGHQSIAAAFGGRVVRAREIRHGKTSQVRHGGEALFERMSNPFVATRYHSLVAEPESLPTVLEPIAWAEPDALGPGGEIMALRHRTHPTWGVQFHPESILTVEGLEVLRNFCHLAGIACR